MRGAIFDLDQTIVDSHVLDPLRRRRQWQQVYAQIGRSRLYEGIPELLGALREASVMIAVVTSTPRTYASRLLSHFGLAVDGLVAFHDTTEHKPNPAPILVALERLNVEAHEAISIGDDPKDILASRSAGVRSVAALWGALDPETLVGARPDEVARTVADLRGILGRWLNQAM